MISLLSDLGAMAFVLWLVWRTTNHTIPRLAEKFEEGIEKQRQDFKAQSEKERSDFAALLAEQRTFFSAQIEREREFSCRQTDSIVETLKELVREVRKND